MVEILDEYEEKSVQHGITNVPNARLKAIMNRRATNALIVANGATNLGTASGVKLVGISRPQMMNWVLCYQQ